MGSRGWTLSTFVGCCIWILHGLRAAAAVPVTTEEPFAVDTASPITADSEGSRSLVMGNVETSVVVTENVLAGSPSSPTFLPRDELDALVTAASEYGSTVPTLSNVTKTFNTTQDMEKSLISPTVAMTAAAISAQHPAVTPEAELGATRASSNDPPGTTPLPADVKEDILTAVTREGSENLDPTSGDVVFITIPPPATTWKAQPTPGSPIAAGVTTLSQGLATATGAGRGVEEGVALPVDTQTETSAISSNLNPGITPEAVGEMAPAAEERPSALVPGDTGDAINGEFNTVSSAHLPLESPTVSGTVGNAGETSFLPGQAVLSPVASLTPASDGDRDGQGAPQVSLEAPGSALSPAASKVPTTPKATEDMATSLLAPGIPTDSQSDTNPSLPGTAPPTGENSATGEQQLAAPLPSSTDKPSASGAAYPPLGAAYPPLGTAYPSLGAAYPPLDTAYQPPGSGAGTVPAAVDGAEIPASPDIPAALGTPVSPSLGGSEPLGVVAAAPQGADEPHTDLNSATGPSNPASFVPGEQAWPTAGVQSQGAEGAGNTAQAGGPGDGSTYADIQSDTSPSSFSAQQDPTNTGELLAEDTGALENAELSPSSVFGAGEAPALGEVSLPGSAPPGSPGLEPTLSGAEGLGDLPGESANTPGAAYPPPGAVAGPVAGAETPVSLDLGAAQGAPVSPSLGLSQPWGAAAGGPQGAGLPGANGPATGLTSAWDAPSSAAHGPAGPPSPALGDQLGTNVGLPATEAHGSGTREPVLGGSGSGTRFEPSLSSAAGSGTAAGIDQPSGADSLSSPASPSDVVAAASVSEGDGAALNPAAAPGPDSLGSPDSETGPDLSLVQGTESSVSTAQTGNPESERPYVETNPSAFSVQQDPTNTRELLTEGTGAVENVELSLPSIVGAGKAPALGEVSLPGSAPPGSPGLEPTLSGAEGLGDLPGESANTPGAAYPPPGAVAGPVSGAETPVSLDLGAAQGAPVSPSLGLSQPWGAAAGGPQGAGLPGANGPATGLTSAWDAPSSAAHGPAGPPSPAPGDQLGTNVGLPATEAHGSGTREPVLGGSGSGTRFEPSLSSAAGSGTAAGIDQPSGADSLSSPASPSDVVSASSVSDPASPSVLGGADSAPGALQPSPSAGPGVPPAVGEGAGEVTGAGGSLAQSQAPAAERASGSGASAGETGPVLQSVSSYPATEGSSSLGTAGKAANGANLPGVGGPSSDLTTGLEAAGLEEPPVSTSSIQSGVDLGLSDAKPSQTDAVELPEGASVNGGPSPGASLGQGSGTGTQITSGALAPSALTSPQELQPLVPVAPESSGVPNDMASSPAASLPLPGHGLSSGLATSGSLHPLPGTPSGLSGDAEGTQTWPLEDEVASGMPAPSGEKYPGAPVSPNAAPALPSAPQRENAAEGASTSPGLSTPLSARESVAGSSVGGRGELGAATLGGSALLLPPQQPGSPGPPSGDADSTGQVSAVLPGAMAGRGDMAQLLPITAGARAGVESPTHSPLGGSSGLPGLPPTGIAPGNSGSKILGPGPARGSSPAALQPFLGDELTTSLANRAPATGGLRLPAAFPGQGGGQGVLPMTAHPAVSCSPTTVSSALPASFPGVREVLPRPEAATVTSRASSPLSPALPGGPVAISTPLSSPTVAAVPLYGYGARENDKEYVERRVDFNSPLFKPETGFPFGKTLRDTLYFTDNGQIIFPPSDNNVIAYPNPPPRGFNGHEEVPMIAVFWDNADFSRGVGTTFYQEFPTLNTAKPPFVRDVETKIRRYLRSSYSAAWTLKITWEKAPAYTARTDTRRTITYQAILTTDGFRSYVLMLYQDGGMQWDYNRLTATNVLIGYTSGDGFYRNDDLTQRPPAAKYRPDQFRGYNTDLRGLWIYKLENRVGPNYRLKCLAWIGRQQEPQTWSHGLPTCPCSLQQGQQDPRFKSSRGGWWAARVSMLHSASPNQHGAGVRCLYNSQSQLIEGRQERYWRSSRQASPYRDQELKLYDWCCNQAGSARLCNHYGKKRPKIGCDGYQSPNMAGSSEETESDSEEQRDGEDE